MARGTVGPSPKVANGRPGIACNSESVGDILVPNAIWEEEYVEEWGIPKCLKCDVGSLVPLSDYGGQGASVHYKAWVCINPSCGFNLKIRNGDIYLNEPIAPGGMSSSRVR